MIIKLVGTIEDETYIYQVFEFAKNGTLRELLKARKRFSLELTRAFTAQIAMAIYYLHSLNISHRDLKLTNIVLDSKFNLKVIDFGTAKVMPKTSSHRQETFVGTLPYMAPEMLRGERSYLATDIWALGIMTYFMVTGWLPFTGGRSQIYQKIVGKTI